MKLKFVENYYDLQNRMRHSAKRTQNCFLKQKIHRSMDEEVVKTPETKKPLEIPNIPDDIPIIEENTKMDSFEQEELDAIDGLLMLRRYYEINKF